MPGQGTHAKAAPSSLTSHGGDPVVFETAGTQAAAGRPAPRAATAFRGGRRASQFLASNGITVRHLQWEQVPWSELDGLPDRSYAQTRASLQYLTQLTRGEPWLVELGREGSTIGWFSGIRRRQLGVQIIGSPMPGWSAAYMGFNLLPGHSRRDALVALTEFAWRSGVHHLEIMDRYLTDADFRGLGFHSKLFRTYATDLRRDEDELFGAMTSACRRAIRKAQKSGVTIQEATPEGFAATYYEQLEGVFGRQGLKPTYDQRRVELLIDHLWPTGNLLLLKAYDPEGECLATGIFPGYGRFSYFWGNASLVDNRQLRPNEAIHWYALRYWKARGMEWHDWGGGMKYKEKYGVTRLVVPRIYISRPQFLMTARSYASRAYFGLRKTRQRIIRRLGSQ